MGKRHLGRLQDHSQLVIVITSRILHATLIAHGVNQGSFSLCWWIEVLHKMAPGGFVFLGSDGYQKNSSKDGPWESQTWLTTDLKETRGGQKYGDSMEHCFKSTWGLDWKVPGRCPSTLPVAPGYEATSIKDGSVHLSLAVRMGQHQAQLNTHGKHMKCTWNAHGRIGNVSYALV